jgi:hypothetical protein
MRLRKFSIRNFKAIQNLELEWDDLLILIENCSSAGHPSKGFGRTVPVIHCWIHEA